MLTPLDDTLLHQAPTTFDHAVTSDHRFFDRWAVGIQHPSASVIYGLANYKNTDVCDGFLCTQLGDRQVNLRVTRPLRPDFSMQVGPLRIEIVEPLWSHRLVVEEHEGSPLHCDLTWTAVLPAREEQLHFERRAGRAHREYCRLDQLGRATGRLGVGEERIDFLDAWTWRDHSWGVRPGMGGADPVHPHPDPGARRSATGSLFVWLAFEAGSVAGQFQTVEAGDGTRLELDGHLLPDTSDPATSLPIVDLVHDITFVDGHTAFGRARLAVTTANGRVWRFDNVPLRPPWVFQGSGYSGGWDDGLGLGVPRGVRLEGDEYRLAGPADVELPGGATAQPWHRETDVAVTLDGATGDGHLTIIATPPVPPSTLGRDGPRPR